MGFNPFEAKTDLTWFIHASWLCTCVIITEPRQTGGATRTSLLLHVCKFFYLLLKKLEHIWRRQFTLFIQGDGKCLLVLLRTLLKPQGKKSDCFKFFSVSYV